VEQDPANPILIHSVRGFGYTFEPKRAMATGVDPNHRAARVAPDSQFHFRLLISSFLNADRRQKAITAQERPLQYAPENELGVVFLFSQIARRLQFRIEEIRAAYPDCIAYLHTGEHEKRVALSLSTNQATSRRIATIRSSAITSCAGATTGRRPKRIKVIELKRFFRSSSQGLDSGRYQKPVGTARQVR